MTELDPTKLTCSTALGPEGISFCNSSFTASVLSVRGANGPIFDLSLDGKVVIHDKDSIDEGARLLYEGLERYGRNIQTENRELKQQLPKDIEAITRTDPKTVKIKFATMEACAAFFNAHSVTEG